MQLAKLYELLSRLFLCVFENKGVKIRIVDSADGELESYNMLDKDLRFSDPVGEACSSTSTGVSCKFLDYSHTWDAGKCLELAVLPTHAKKLKVDL